MSAHVLESGLQNEPSAPPYPPPDYETLIQEWQRPEPTQDKPKRSCFSIPWQSLLSFIFLLLSIPLNLIMLSFMLLGLLIQIVTVILPPFSIFAFYLIGGSWRLISLTELFLLDQISEWTVSRLFQPIEFKSKPHLIPYAEKFTDRCFNMFHDSFTWLGFIYFPLIKLPLLIISCLFTMILLTLSCFCMFNWLIFLYHKSLFGDSILETLYQTPNTFLHSLWGSLVMIPLGRLLLFQLVLVDYYAKLLILFSYINKH